MKLILHAGTHKTATTQFQEVCYLNYDLLSRSGLLYPKVELLPDNSGISNLSKEKSFNQHSFLQRLAVKNDITSIFQFFRDSFQEAKRLNCIYTLCSGEDLETALLDVSVAMMIETEAQSAGYDEIEWIFVKRNSLDYYSSLYSQFARQAIVCDPLTLLQAIENHGYFAVTNSVGVFHYIFDINDRFKKLKKATSGSIRMIPFEKFVEGDGFAGKSLLFELIDQTPSIVSS